MMMRWWAIAALMAVITMLPARPVHAQSDTPGDLTDGLVACWDMDETSGVRHDAWGGHHLTDNNTVGSSAGLVGLAADFVAANHEALSLDDSADLAYGGLSYAFYAIFYNGGGPVVYKDGEYSLEGAVDSVNFWAFGKPSTVVTLPAQAGWQVVVAQVSGNNAEIHANNMANSAILQAPTASTPALVYIGSHGDMSRVYANAPIDTIATWTRTLNANERAWLDNNGRGRSCNEIIATAPQPAQSAVVQISDSAAYVVDYRFTFGDIAMVIVLSVIVLAQVIPGIMEVIDRWFP